MKFGGIVVCGSVASLALSMGAAWAAPVIGSKAPEFNLATIRGERVKLSAIKGHQPILVNFFSTG